MKPPPFAYVRPDTLDDAMALLAEHGDAAKLLAGGQSLMATLNMRLSAPDVLIDINRIDGLSGISLDSDTVRIGAMTRHVEVETSDIVAEHLPLIASAMEHVAHPAIRNRGTFGGSVAFADPAAEMPACALTLGATMVIRGQSGERRVAASDFFHGLYETACGADEILVAVELPAIRDGEKSVFMELARRHGDYAIIGLCAHGGVSGGTVDNLSLIYFGAGDRPVPAPAAAAALNGTSADDAALDAAAAALVSDLDPPEDLNATPGMRLHLAGVLLKRAMKEMTA